MTNTFRDSERARAAKRLIRRIAVLLVFALCIGMFAAQAGADEGTVRISFGTLPAFEKDITVGLYKVGNISADGIWTMEYPTIKLPESGLDFAAHDAQLQQAVEAAEGVLKANPGLEPVTGIVDQNTGSLVISVPEPGVYFGKLVDGPLDFSMNSFFVGLLTEIEFDMSPKWNLITSTTVVKSWNDDKNRDGIRDAGTYVDVELYQDGTLYKDEEGKIVHQRLNDGNSWTYTQENLPKYRTSSTSRLSGDLYQYEWKEAGTNLPAGTYKLSSDVSTAGPTDTEYWHNWTTTITNTHEPERTNREVRKDWQDDDNHDFVRPATIKATLKKTVSGKTSDVETFTLSAENNWTARKDNLFVYENGERIVYTWAETLEKKDSENYTYTGSETSTVKGEDGVTRIRTTLSNKHDTENTSVVVRKVWSDKDNQDGKRPAKIELTLLRDGEKFATVELPNKDSVEVDANTWEYTRTGLEKFIKGTRNEHVYTWQETELASDLGYGIPDINRTGNTTIITNPHTPETVRLTIIKKWDDDNNRDRVRPKSIRVHIRNNLTEKDKIKPLDTWVMLTEKDNATQNDANQWTYESIEYPKYCDGKEIVYSIEEVEVNGYKAAWEKSNRNDYAWTITNSHEPSTRNISVEKIWDDKDNVDGIRPESISVQLLADGVPFGEAVTLSASNAWTHRWTDLKVKNANGEVISYRVSESKVDGYEEPKITGSMTTGFRITNPHTPYTGSLKIQKNVTVNGEATTGTAADGTYSFQVTGPNNYSQTVEIAVTNGKSGVTTINDLTPGTYTVTEEVPSDMTLVEENGRSVEVTGNNTSDIPTVAFTNDLTVEPSLGSLRIRKSVTVNSNATRGTRADGTYTFRVTGPNNYDQTVEITITNGASRTVRLNNLTPGTYTVTETVPSGMTLVGGNDKTADVTANNTSDIPVVSFTNNRRVTTPTPTPPTTPTPVVTTPPSRITTTTPTPTRTTVTPTPSTPRTITGSKVWVDDNNSHGTRPSSITLHLYANGSEVAATPTWSSTDGDVWSYTYTGLPSVDSAGRTITYTVGEESVAGYNGTVSGFTITNRLVPQPPQNYISVSGQKSWADDANAEGLRPGYITVRLYRNGTEIDSRNVTAGTGWSYTFASLPADDGYGNVYTYTVREDGVPGYYARQDGFNLTNYRLPPTTTPPPTVPRTSSTPPPAFETLTEENLEDLLDIFDYDTPLWGGLLGTGDTIPVYPFVFGGIGIAALLVLIIFGRRRKDEGAAA